MAELSNFVFSREYAEGESMHFVYVFVLSPLPFFLLQKPLNGRVQTDSNLRKQKRHEQREENGRGKDNDEEKVRESEILVLYLIQRNE